MIKRPHNTMKPIHPFPARMAPEIALDAISKLPKKSRILDPMTGSGTVLRQAIVMGHNVVGYDLDPLAVLMSKVWTYRLDTVLLQTQFKKLIKDISTLKVKQAYLPWIDEDKETKDFINFWFDKPQQKVLRMLAFLFQKYEKQNIDENVLNALKLALSRIIVTKKSGASLAWDVSHSRPHKVKVANDYDVLLGFSKSVDKLIKQLTSEEITGKSAIRRGDARKLRYLRDNSIDAVITSPPYLNAIDYLRGHKLSLVWFGYKISDLRNIRSISIGAEKGIWTTEQIIIRIRNSVIKGTLPLPKTRMVERYIEDSMGIMSEISRVLTKKGKAILVVGDSCLKGVYIENSNIFKKAGKLYGLKLVKAEEREIPQSNRYLPIPKGKRQPLGKRMRSEHILTFVQAA